MTENEIKILLGQNLKFLRKEQQLSQMQLAEKAEVTFNFINDIENGKKWISPATLSKLSIALNVQPYRFFMSVQSASVKHTQKIPDRTLTTFSDDVMNQISTIMQKTLERYL